MRRFAATPDPPYYAVIFSAQRTEGDHGYGAMAAQTVELALAQPGCLGAESTPTPRASASPSPTGATRLVSKPIPIYS